MPLSADRAHVFTHVRRTAVVAARMRTLRWVGVVIVGDRRRAIRLAGRTIPCRGRAARLMRHRCAIYRPLVERGEESAGASTRYVALATDVCCLVQAESSTSEYEDSRLAGRVRYRGYFPPDADVRTGDVIEVSLLGRTVRLHVDAPASDPSGHGEYVVAPLSHTAGGIRP